MGTNDRISALVCLGLLTLTHLAAGRELLGAELTVYPPLPNNQYGSDIYEVTVSQGQENCASYVYKSTREGGNATDFATDANHWTSFSFRGAVTVQVKLRDGPPVKTAVIRPLSKNIRAKVASHVVSFTLTVPANVYVELDGKPRDPLFIFANPVETNVPAGPGPGVLYFGPGVTDLGKEPLTIADGQTVYLAGGAYVKGRLQVAETTRGTAVTIRGRGILSGVGIAESRGTFRQCMIGAVHKPPELHVEGIVIADSPGVHLLAFNRLVAENIKLLSWLPQTDGISGGQNSLVHGCFLKVNDDVLHFHKSGTKLIDNVVWRQNFGSVLQMGWNETQNVDGELCDGLDVIADDRGRSRHVNGTWSNANVVALIDIHKSAGYKNIVIENVRHEKTAFQLFGLRTMLAAEDTIAGHAKYRDGRGSVDGMVFRNIIAVEKPLNPSVFDGNGSEPGSIANVTFENLQIAGETVTEANASAYILQRGKASGFRFLATGNHSSKRRWP